MNIMEPGRLVAKSTDVPSTDLPPVTMGIVGTGYVASFYAGTLAGHKTLRLAGGYDINPRNLAAFSRQWNVRTYGSLEEILNDPQIELILNLTDPRSHYTVSKACLEAGKHVYSEKPLGMTLDEAKTLVALAEQKNVLLASAPCNMLSATAQTIWKAIQDGVVGKIRLVYANFDDGLVGPAMAPWTWFNKCGLQWPAKDEFEVGCTYIHAGYVLTWLAAFFGPARTVTAFSSCQIPDKGVPVDSMAPDFSVGCIEYDDNVVARVTCGLVAPRDKSLTIVGDDGVIFTNTVRNDSGAVYVRRIPSQGRLGGVERRLNRALSWLEKRSPYALWGTNSLHVSRKLPFARTPSNNIVGIGKEVDFNLGPAEMAEAIRLGRPCRLSPQLGLHLVELIEVLQYPERFGGKRKIESTFDPIQPLPWIS
jgi:predicted dehydrogenase